MRDAAGSATWPSLREAVCGLGVVGTWCLSGLAARRPPEEAAEWVLGAYLVAGMFFLGAAWPEVVGPVTTVRRRGRRWWAFVIGIAIGARLAVLPLPPSDDVARYVVEGQVLLHGENPYVVAPADPRLDSIRDERFARVNHPDLPAIYPPLTLAVCALVSRVTTDERVWKFLALVGDLAVIGALAAAIAERGDDPRRLLLYAWNPVAIYAFAGRGHNDALLVLFVALAAWASVRDWPAGVGVALAGAVLAKLSAGILAPILLSRREWRGTVAFGAVLALGFAPLLLAEGDPLRSLRTFAGELHANGSIHFAAYEILSGWCFPDETAGRFATVLSGMLLLGVIAAAVGLVKCRIVEPLGAAAWVMTAALLVAPTVHVWYLSWAVVLLPFAGRVGLALAIWSVTVGLTLAVEVEQTRTGTWRELSWVRLPEYAPVFLALAWRLRTIPPFIITK